MDRDGRGKPAARSTSEMNRSRGSSRPGIRDKKPSGRKAQKTSNAPNRSSPARKKARKKKLKLRTRGKITLTAIGFSILATLGLGDNHSKASPNFAPEKGPESGERYSQEDMGKIRIEPVKVSRGEQKYGLSKADIERSVLLVGAFEGRDLYQSLSGNFDGQGISMGLFQWNLGSSTLQPLLKEYVEKHKDDGMLDRVFGHNKNELLNMLYNYDKNQQVAWGEKVTNPGNRTKLKEPWDTAFRELCSQRDFIEIQKKATRGYVNNAFEIMDKYGLETRTGFVFALDIAVQNGHGILYAHSEINERFRSMEDSLGRKLTQKEKRRIVAEEVVERSNPEWRDNVERRKMALAKGEGVIHGVSFRIGD